MSEDGEIWEAIRKDGQEKRRRNEEQSIQMLRELGIPFKVLSFSSSHYRVGSYDYWPSTGRFYDQKKQLGGRGVKNLITLLKNANTRN
jgi:hypothetical protein